MWKTSALYVRFTNTAWAVTRFPYFIASLKPKRESLFVETQVESVYKF